MPPGHEPFLLAQVYFNCTLDSSEFLPSCYAKNTQNISFKRNTGPISYRISQSHPHVWIWYGTFFLNLISSQINHMFHQFIILLGTNKVISRLFAYTSRTLWLEVLKAFYFGQLAKLAVAPG